MHFKKIQLYLLKIKCISMKTTKYFILLAVFFGSFNCLIAQSVIYSNEENFKVNNEENSTQEQSELKTENSRVSYHVEVGSSFMTNKQYGNMFTFFTSPSLRLRLSPGLNIKAGLMMINTSINSYYNSENPNIKNYSTYLMTGFDYNKEKLRISGEILYGQNKNLFSAKNSPEYLVSFRAEYKITENMSIGLQVINQNMNQGFNNQFGSPFYNPYSRLNTYTGF